MNVFIHELKTNYKKAIKWTLITFLITLVALMFYPMINEDLDKMVDLLKNYPKAFQVAFGFTDNMVNSSLGYFSTLPYKFMLIGGSLFSFILGINIITKEKRTKTADFLFSKPITRSNIFISKLLSSFTLILISTLVLSVLNYLVLITISSSNINLELYFKLSLAYFLIQIFLLTISIIIGTNLKGKNNTAVSLALVFGFVALDSTVSDKLNLFIPYRYFNTENIMNNISFDLFYLVMFFILNLIFILLALKIFNKKDI